MCDITFGLTGLEKNGSKSFIDEKICTTLLNGHDHIGIASTIIDETLHARLLGVFGAYGIDPTEVYHNGKDPKDLPQTKSRIIFESENFKQNYPGLYDYYSK